MPVTEQELEERLIPIEWTANILLFLLVFGMSSTVGLGDVSQQLLNIKGIGTGVFLQYGLMPLLGFGAVRLLKLEEPMGITLLVLTSSPGGSFSNWFCATFNGDLSLSVAMTTISTLLSVFALPSNLIFYTKHAYGAQGVVESIDWNAIYVAVAIVISAILTGMICATVIPWTAFGKCANLTGNLAGILLVAFNFCFTSQDTESDLIGRDWEFYVGVAFPVIVAIVAGNVITTLLRLPKVERVTVTIECCFQNCGIASSVAMNMYRGRDLAEALGVPLFYALCQATGLSIYAIGAWKMGWTKAPSNDSFFHMITTNYEVEPLEKDLVNDNDEINDIIVMEDKTNPLDHHIV